MRDPRLDQLADYVRDTRKRKNLNQALIRKRGGPSSGWLGELESGAMITFPKLATLKKLALGLNEPLEDVLKAAGFVDPVESWTTFYRFQSTLKKNGFAKTVANLKAPVNAEFVRKLRATIELFEENESEDGEMLTSDRHLMQIAIIVLDIVDGKRAEKLSKDESETYKFAVWPTPSTDLYKFIEIKDEEPFTSVGSDDGVEYRRIPTHFAKNTDYIFEVKGNFLEKFGYPDGTWLFVDTVISGRGLENREVLAAIEGDWLCGIFRRDDLGTYIETNVRDLQWRFPAYQDVVTAAISNVWIKKFTSLDDEIPF